MRLGPAVALLSAALLAIVACSGCAADAPPPPKTAHAHGDVPPNMVMLDYQPPERPAPPPMIFDEATPMHVRLHESLTLGKNNPDKTYDLERAELEATEPVVYGGSDFSSDVPYAYARGGGRGGHGHHGGGNSNVPSAPTPRVIGGNWPSAPTFGPGPVMMTTGAR